MAFALLQTHLNAPNIRFSATIEKWCSSTHAELAAVFVALIISPYNSNINIYTDCKSLIDHYHYLLSPLHNNSIRNFFKEPTNNLLWNMIMDVISNRSINVTFHKVKAIRVIHIMN